MLRAQVLCHKLIRLATGGCLLLIGDEGALVGAPPHLREHVGDLPDTIRMVGHDSYSEVRDDFLKAQGFPALPASGLQRSFNLLMVRGALVIAVVWRSWTRAEDRAMV